MGTPVLSPLLDTFNVMRTQPDADTVVDDSIEKKKTTCNGSETSSHRKN